MIVVDATGRIAVFEDSPVGAAHSMDTDWFAVDGAGRVGYMRSGEEGSIPWVAHRQYWGDLYIDLVVARITSASPDEPWSERAALQRALDGAADPVERDLVRSILAGDDASRIVYLDWLESNNKTIAGFPHDHAVFRIDRDFRRISVEDLPAQFDCVLRFSHPEYLAMFREDTWRYTGRWRVLDERLGMTDTVAVTELHEYGFTDFWEAGELETIYHVGSEYELEPHMMGLYVYECSFSGPYRRNAVPARPLMLADLPEGLRTTLEGLRIPQSFASLESFEPERFGDCQRYRDD
jgi:hypothetical protein